MLLVLTGLLALMILWRRRDESSCFRGRDAFAVALGCLVTLLGAPMAWLHYYLLATPLIFYCLRPGLGVATTVRVSICGVLFLGLALYPVIQVFWLEGQEQFATVCSLSAAGIFVLACFATEDKSAQRTT